MRTTLDILAPHVRADPYPHYAALRRDSPVCLAEPGGVWLVSRHDDIMALLRDPTRFSSQAFRAVWEPPWLDYNPLARSILAMDAPGHTRLRALASRSLGPRAVARLQPAIRARCERLAAGLDGEVDVVAAYAAPLPAFVIATLLGLDESLWVRFKRWSDDLLSVTPQPLDAHHVARVEATIAELSGYLSRVIADRRRAPKDDPVSEMVRAEVDGQRLGDAEILEFMIAILIGGLETTTHLIASSALLLAGRPDLFARLRGDPAAIPAFVEEMLRFDGPSQSLPRVTTCDVELHGVTIPAGSLVLALVGSAGRDERRFLDPDRFDLGRGSAALNFGHGVHFCLGAALARLQGRVGLSALARRLPGLRLAGDQPLAFRQVVMFRGLVALEVAWDPPVAAPRPA